MTSAAAMPTRAVASGDRSEAGALFRLHRAGPGAPPALAPEDGRLVTAIDPRRLGEWVRELAVPRSYFAEPRGNRRVGDLLGEMLTAAGLEVTEVGIHRNLVARDPRLHDAGGPAAPAVIVGAHYDAVAGSPGADDNASGLAALVAIAEQLTRREEPSPIVLVAFNAEEDGLLGSRELAPLLARATPPPRVAHVLEMIGYRDLRAGAQSLPPGLPIELPGRGDFIGLVGDRAAASTLRRAVDLVRVLAAPPVVALECERRVAMAHPVLRRSDHSAFWEAGVAAVMWTDTAEFRNPNYHRDSDRAETLDLDFLAAVTRLVLLTALGDAAVEAVDVVLDHRPSAAAR